MREMGIQTVYPYLFKGVNITRTNQVWSSDITYIRLQNSRMYLTAIIFWRSLKSEEVYLKDYGSTKEARLNICGYMGLYNEDWPHQALD